MRRSRRTGLRALIVTVAATAAMLIAGATIAQADSGSQPPAVNPTPSPSASGDNTPWG